MEIWELETQNGRIFRVCVANKSQEKRLFKLIYKNKEKSYEKFIRKDVVTNGIHDMKAFERLAESLQ